MLRRSLILVMAAAAGLGLVACGDDNSDDNGSAAAPATQAAPAATATTDDSGGGGAKVAIAADPNGKLAYDKKTLTAPAGGFEMDFDNESQIPHNVTIEASGDRDAGATETVTGASTSKTFNLEAGKYTFYCSVGNHRQAGMEGTLTVK